MSIDWHARARADRDEIARLLAANADQRKKMGEVSQELDRLAQHFRDWKELPHTAVIVAELASALRQAAEGQVSG